MPYFAVDDGAHANLKFRRASMAARGLWVTVGSWVSDQLTDGHVPGDVVRMYGGTPAQVRSLVAVGMWHVHGHECPRCPQPPGRATTTCTTTPRTETRPGRRSRRGASRASRAVSGTASGRPRRRRRRAASSSASTTPTRPAPPRRSTIPQGWRPTADDIRAAQTARVDAGLQPLTNDQLRSTTAKFINRQLDDGRLAVAWGGRWQEWAENERTAPPPMPGSNVVPLARAAGASTADQRAAAAYQLAARLEEQED